MIITVDELLPSLNRLQNLHWAAKARLKDKWFILIRLSAAPYKTDRNERYKVIITRYAPRQLDYDNLVGACKSIILDNIKSHNRRKMGKAYLVLDDLAYIYDDDSGHLTAEYRQVKSKEKKVTIEIEKITTPARGVIP